jgi:hypothetical protein
VSSNEEERANIGSGLILHFLHEFCDIFWQRNIDVMAMCPMVLYTQANGVEIIGVGGNMQVTVTRETVHFHTSPPLSRVFHQPCFGDFLLVLGAKKGVSNGGVGATALRFLLVAAHFF